MNCFNHIQETAVGICKVCHKAVCQTCTKDEGYGIVCSETCLQELREQREVIERNKKIYGIGSYKSNMPSTGLIVWILFALTFWGLFFYNYSMVGMIDILSLVMAVLFTIVAGLASYSNKRTGIKC